MLAREPVSLLNNPTLLQIHELLHRVRRKLGDVAVGRGRRVPVRVAAPKMHPRPHERGPEAEARQVREKERCRHVSSAWISPFVRHHHRGRKSGKEGLQLSTIFRDRLTRTRVKPDVHRSCCLSRSTSV